MNEPLAGYTRGGSPVTRNLNQNLSFSIISIGWERRMFAFSVAVECNKNAEGKKRPYLVIQLFGLLIQSGWLF